MSPFRSATHSSAAEGDTGAAAPAAAPTPIQSDIDDLVKEIEAGRAVHVLSPDQKLEYVLYPASTTEGIQLFWRSAGAADSLVPLYPDHIQRYPHGHPLQIGYRQIVFHLLYTTPLLSREGYREACVRTLLGAIFAGKPVNQLTCSNVLGSMEPSLHYPRVI